MTTPIGKAPNDGGGDLAYRDIEKVKGAIHEMRGDSFFRRYADTVERLVRRVESLQDHYECKMSTPQRVSVIEKERDALRLELEKEREISRQWNRDNQALVLRNHDLKKRAERLAGALREYGKHDSDCILSRWSQGRPTADGGYECMYGGKWYQVRPEDKAPKCECGFDEALSLEAGWDK